MLCEKAEWLGEKEKEEVGEREDGKGRVEEREEEGRER